MRELEREPRQRSKIYVIDTGVILLGANLSSLDGDIYAPKEVVEEVKERILRAMIDALVAAGVVKIFEPSSVSLRRATDVYNRLGGRGVSKADLQVIATALDLSERGNVVVLTDDYAIQNILEYLGIRYRSISQVGIKRLFRWVKLCPACKSKYEDLSLSKCPACGTELVAVPRRLKRRDKDPDGVK